MVLELLSQVVFAILSVAHVADAKVFVGGNDCYFVLGLF